jgi:hypothetical protein
MTTRRGEVFYVAVLATMCISAITVLVVMLSGG